MPGEPCPVTVPPRQGWPAAEQLVSEVGFEPTPTFVDQTALTGTETRSKTNSQSKKKAREWQCKLFPHVNTSYTKKNNATRHVQTTHLNFKYLCNICQAITNRRDDHMCKRGKQDKHSTFQHHLKNPKHGSKNCTQKNQPR